LKNIVLINYIDLVGQALLNFLNGSDVPENAKGKYFINLSPSNKKQLQFYMNSMLKNNLFFGKKTIIIHTCDVENNWRNSLGDSWKSVKYKITDDSVWLEPSAMNCFFDKEFKRIEKEFKKCSFISTHEIDSFDLKFYLKRILGVDCFNEKGYNIIEDGNIVYERNNYFPDFILNDIEAKLRHNNIII
jgi:hypothetical protein